MSNKLHLIDTHAHLSSAPLYEQIDLVLERARAAGVAEVINICTSYQGLEAGLRIHSENSLFHNAAAVHPHDTAEIGQTFFPQVVQHAKQGHLVAIGETGLDYFYKHSEPNVQQDFFRRHLQLALECQLPVVIHCRDAFPDVLKIIDEVYQGGTGVFHCFTGTQAEAEQALARGWYLSISGIVTFKKSEELRQVVRKAPIDRLLIETDAPFLAPQSHRGKQNEPAYLLETATVVAALKEISLQELSYKLVENTKRLFVFK